MSRSDAVWSEEGTTPDAIEAALRKLLAERHAENGGYVPARVLNMIAFVDHEWSGEIANRLRGVGRYHASRTLVLAYEPRRERLDARVTIASEGPGPRASGSPPKEIPRRGSRRCCARRWSSSSAIATSTTCSRSTTRW